MALFTPDDEVTSRGEMYLQARPNVVYELGWFCGRLGRPGVMLLLQTGTILFSDFGSIIRKEFSKTYRKKQARFARALLQPEYPPPDRRPAAQRGRKVNCTWASPQISCTSATTPAISKQRRRTRLE